jgi:hypothetical protein
MNTPIPITLSNVEMLNAATVGVTRRLAAVKHQRNHNNGAPTIDMWGMDIEGAGAELVVAKWLGRYWNALASDPTTLEGDVGRYQVRHTKRTDGCLILHEKDNNDAVFILVVGQYPTYEVRGWISGREGKQIKHWRAVERPAYFVPQSALLDPTELEMSVKCREL